MIIVSSSAKTIAEFQLDMGQHFRDLAERIRAHSHIAAESQRPAIEARAAAFEFAADTVETVRVDPAAVALNRKIDGKEPPKP